MLREEADDRVVAANAVRELQHVVALVLEDEVVDVSPEPAQLLDDVARLTLDDTRVVLALDDEQRARDVRDVRLRRAVDEEVVILLRVADREREVRLPRLGEAIDEREQVVRARTCRRRRATARGGARRA